MSIEVESGTVEAFGAPLYYEVAGTGPALVLIHEGLADHRMYDDQFFYFAQYYRVVRYDLYGFGRSGLPEQEYNYYDSLRMLLRHLNIDRAVLWGMSLGGNIALDFTLQYPEMVNGLVLMAVGMRGYPNAEEDNVRFAPMAEAFKSGDFVRALELSVRLWFDGSERGPDEVDPTARERFRNLYLDVLRRSRDGMRSGVMLEPPVHTRLAEIHVPTLAVVGSGDAVTVKHVADTLASEITGARKVVIPKVAHLLNMELPAEINNLVLNFLREQIP
jgi:pimeloyl-ACP methyl ester carboxylesterase